LPPQEREERGFARLGFEGVPRPLTYRLKPETRTCPKTSKAAQKIDIQRILAYANRIYICVAHGHGLKKHIYMA
jgi:hypothetical protein